MHFGSAHQALCQAAKLRLHTLQHGRAVGTVEQPSNKPKRPTEHQGGNYEQSRLQTHPDGARR